MARAKPTVHPLNREDLFDRDGISYLRISTVGEDTVQSRGSGLDRQRGALADLTGYFKLNVDQALEDRLSASKGHNKTKGHLARLLALIDEGDKLRGKVLLIEAVDRLTREPVFDALAVLKKLIIDGGMILVTGDRSIWDEASINSDMILKLVIEIRAAFKYAQRLAEMARGAHTRRRDRIEAVANDPDHAPPVTLNSSPPAWMSRPKGTKTPVLIPERVATIKLAFELCLQGYTCLQIAMHLNEQGQATFSYGKRQRGAWSGMSVGALLRNHAVIGMVQPCQRDGTSRTPIGQAARVYPAAIGDDLWIAVRDRLNAKQNKLKGCRGQNIPNLFTGKVFCKTCGKAMRVASGGDPGWLGKGFVCGSWLETRICKDSAKYKVNYYEREIMYELSRAAPRQTRAIDERKLESDLATLRIKIDATVRSMTTLMPHTGASAALAEQIVSLGKSIDADRKSALTLKSRITAGRAPASRAQDMHAFMKTLIRPALSGDVEARQKLRNLLSEVDFRITGADGIGGMIVKYGDRIYEILPEGEDGREAA